MAEQKFFKLDPSETSIFRAAAQIYAGFLASGKVTDSNKRDVLKESVQTAIQMADYIEDAIQSDDEAPVDD